MEKPDIVAELDAWLSRSWPWPQNKLNTMAQRARDEIVELRGYGNSALTVTQMLKALQQARSDALEEAAKLCDEYGTPITVSDAIRALKEDAL